MLIWGTGSSLRLAWFTVIAFNNPYCFPARGAVKESGSVKEPVLPVGTGPGADPAADVAARQ